MSFRQCGRLGQRLAQTAFIFLSLVGRLSAASPYVEPQYALVGWDGHVVLGSWATLSTECRIEEPGNYRLDVTATDPDGNLATFIGNEITFTSGRQRLTGHFQLGRPDGVVTARIVRDQQTWRDVVVPAIGSSTTALIPHTQAERLLVTSGLPESVQSTFDPQAPGRRTVFHLPDSAGLPLDDLAYDAVAGLFLAGAQSPSAEQSAAIHRWVRRGGRLFISVGLKPPEFRDSALANILPVTIDPEPLSIRELTALESYAGKSVRIMPTGTRTLIPKFTFPFGKSLAGARNGSVLIQVPLGFGTVTLLGLDVTKTPVKDWEGLRDLLRRMTATGESASAVAGRSQQLGSTGITEMASQVSAALENYETVSRTSPWWILGGLAIVMVLIGPLDYWLVARVWQRPLMTWISFPLLLALSAFAAIWAANSTNGRNWRVNQLDIVDLDVDSGFTRGRHFAAVYSPESTAAAVKFQPVWPSWSKSAEAMPRQMLGWFGLPETSFGGMYRSGSGVFHAGQGHYTLQPQAGVIGDLPVAQWSTAALAANSEASLPGLVESKLSSSATGRLSGTITHRFPGELTNWFLTYAGRIYRLPTKENPQAVIPLAPRQVFRVEQQSVVQRELRGYLTRTTAREVQRIKEKPTSEIVMQQGNYDPLSQDLASILPILSFYDDVGGGSYTGLANETLADQDLSPLLELDRAVLFGYLDQPAAEISLAPGAAPVVQRTTVVRLLLPVDRSKQAIRELPKTYKP